VLLLERAAYHGGRCEAWHLGPVEGEVFKVDVNSLYPSQMANKLHPVKLKKLYPEGSLELLLEHARYDFVIADVTVELTEPIVPLRKDKLLFPVGRFKTVLTSHELDLVPASSIKEVRAVAVYEQAPVFKEFVEYFYGER